MTKTTRSIVRIIVFILCFCSIYVESNSFAAVVGDIDSDGQITLVESIYALRVTSGLTTPIPDTICYTQGLADCSGDCVDTMNNPNYCGDCDTSCPEGYLCVSGTCANVCDDGDDICTNDLFDLVEGCTHTIPPECQSCNPVAQTECPPDYKCSFTVDNGTLCTQDGSKVLGDICEVTIEGADDCVAGTYCLSGYCSEICSISPDSCPEFYNCQESSEYFTDLSNVGICSPNCDPVFQDCSDEDNVCNLYPITGVSICSELPPESVGRVQGDPCYGPSSGVCYINGCDKGYGIDMLWNDPATCSFFCTPIDNWKDNENGLAGDPAGITCNSTFGGIRPDGPGAGYECLYIQSLFANTDLTPATTGTCRPVSTNGSCANFDWVQLQADILDETASQEDYCVDHPDRCMLECISIATFETVYQTLETAYSAESLYLQLSNLIPRSNKSNLLLIH